MVSRPTRIVIARTVLAAGGDRDDYRALVATWERLERHWAPRVDAMRREAAAVRCNCHGGPLLDEGADRCQRCGKWAA